MATAWQHVDGEAHETTEIRGISGRPENESGLRSEAYYEGEFFWDHCHFGGGLEGDLVVYYGNHGDYTAEGFIGKLQDADVRELIEKGAETLPPRKENLIRHQRSERDNASRIC